MANITLTAGTLSPPACYANDQDRLEAFVAAIIAAITGGIQWEAQVSAPVDLTEYWLQTDANGRPRHIRKYSTADGKWVPLIDSPFIPDSVGGTGDAITLANTPTFNSGSTFITGRRFVFLSPGANTGAVTLAVDGLAAKPVVKHSGDALAAGDILSGQIVDVIYNLSADWFELQTPPAAFVMTAAEVRGVVSPPNTCPVPGAGSSGTIAHTVGSVPAIWFLRLKCKGTTPPTSGYAVGDEIDPISVLADQGSSSYIPAFTYGIDDSAVTVLRHTAGGAGGTKIHDKSAPGTVVGATFVDANWEFVLHVI